MATENKAFYDAVTCVLSCALQADSEIQRLAEERKKALEMVDEYPFILVEIIGSSEEALAEKHMASIFLKNYFHDIFMGKTESQIFKSPITLCRLCLGLVDLLRLNFVSIKTMVCKSLSYIAFKGFWGIIDHKIFPMLKSENEEQVYNAVFFLKQCMNYDEFKIGGPLKTNPEYFEVLLTIFQRNIPSELRYLTIQPMFYVICYCLELEVQENALSRLGVEFYKVLNEPYSEYCDFKLKSEVINFITKFELLGPTKHCHIITNSLPAIGKLMIGCCDQFREIVKGTISIPRDPSEDFDEESTNFLDLINLILDLIRSMLTSMYFDLLLEDLDNLLYCLFTFMCCYDDMEEELFLEDTEKTQLFPIRTKAANILTHIKIKVVSGRRKGSEIFYKSILSVFHRMMEEVQLVSTNRPIFHARVTESLMFGLGSLGYDPQVDHVFPHSYYIDNWTNQMHHTSSAILKGRLLWLGGIFSCLLSLETSTLHLKSIVENLRGDTRYLFLPSVEALRNHMITYDKQAMPPGNHFIIKSLSTELAECLLTMSQKMNNPTSCLNTLGIFVKHQEQCAFAYTHEIQHMIITILYTHLSDNLVMREVNFILGNIATKPSLQKSLHHTMVPFLCKVLHGELTGGFQGRKNSLDKALEMLKTIVVHHTPPICEALIIQGFSGAANILLDTEQDYDCTMNEAAIDFITTMLAKIGSQVNYIRNSKEVPLAEYIPKIIFECIDSLKPVSGLHVCKLCVVGILTLPDVMEPQFKSILKSILSAIQADSSYENVRGLWLMFIYIFMCRPSNTSTFLSSIPGPNGGSALNFLINIWKPEYISLMSKFERTILVMGLVEVIRFGLGTDGDLFKEIKVFLNTKDRPSNEMSGIEYAYLLLIFLVLMEHTLIKEVEEPCLEGLFDPGEGKEDEVLLSMPPLNINVITLAKHILKHENTYYFNVCRNYLYQEELTDLSDMGYIVPQVSME